MNVKSSIITTVLLVIIPVADLLLSTLPISLAFAKDYSTAVVLDVRWGSEGKGILEAIEK